jgi:hypothetical protein
MGYDFGKRYAKSDETKKQYNNTPFDFGDIKVKMYKPKFDKSADVNYNRFDIIPFKITSKKHPLVAAGDWQVGDFDYMMDLWVHKNIGPKHSTILCPYRTYGKTCPICEEASKAYDAEDKEKGRQLKAQRRVYYNVVSRNKGDGDEIQLFDVSHAWFEEPLRKAAKSEGEDEGAGAIDYAHPSKGKTVRFDVSDSGINPKVPALKYESFKFYDRDSIEERIKDALPLDSFLKLLDAKEIEKVLFADFEEEEEEEVEEEERKPVVTEKATEAPPVKEEAPAKPACPHGHEFGKDTDEFRECENCPKDTWKACDRASRGKVPF